MAKGIIVGDRFEVVGVGRTDNWPAQGATGTYRVADAARTPNGRDRIVTLALVTGNHLCGKLKLYVVESLLWQFQAAGLAVPQPVPAKA